MLAPRGFGGHSRAAIRTTDRGAPVRSQFLLERLYLAPELDGPSSTRLKAVGRLLNAAFDGPPPDAEMERLLDHLAAIPAQPRALALAS